ncbi:hypothetical protein [Sphingomonas jatrophae]|uniref:hypothetical protein n=1 Tax=Sphingomonas jatrophae TaxID=1166337 RepID=UPI000B8196AB|nr:hypothetical protein [Sphingomonas jatrophae]
MPHWDDLSQWMKAQLAVFTLEIWSFQTFTMHVHPDLERRWVAEGKDPRVMMRDRLRREFDRHVRPRLDWFFVIEGWSTRTRDATILHIHGGAATFEAGDEEKVMLAAARAAGHGLKGYSTVPRAIHGRKFRKLQAAYIDYLFKFTRRSDPRLREKRFTMSRTMTGGARAFWGLVTEG